MILLMTLTGFVLGAGCVVGALVVVHHTIGVHTRYQCNDCESARKRREERL